MRVTRRTGEFKIYWLNKITLTAPIAFSLSEIKIQARTKILGDNRM